MDVLLQHAVVRCDACKVYDVVVLQMAIQSYPRLASSQSKVQPP